MTEEEAKQAHQERMQYTVISGEPTNPTAFIEISDDYIGIGFLDNMMRETLSYQFQEKEKNRVFLTMATHREYEGDTVKSGTTYFFDTSGEVSVEKVDFEKNEKVSSQTAFNPDSNWEDYPRFGSYSKILKRNR